MSGGAGTAASAGSSADAGSRAAAGASTNGGSPTNGGAVANGGNRAGSESASAGAGGTSSHAGVVASPGCALAKSAPTGDGLVDYALPDTYDGVTPWPLLLELRATNVSAGIAKARSPSKALNQRYVVVAPKTSQDPNGSFEGLMKAQFLAQIEAALAEVCFDESRVFAAGNGSGGRVLTKWLLPPASAGAAQVESVPALRAIAVVGAYTGRYNAPTPVIFIHGTALPDSRAFSDLDGTKALKLFLTGNACAESSAPADVAGCPSADVVMDPHCVDFDGCVAAVRWCQPDDPASNASADPWPCFANEAIDQFFAPYLD